MVLVLEVPLAAIALVLSLMSWKTIRVIRHLQVGNSFWIPVLVSGILFLAGSFVAILNDLDLSFSTYTVEIIGIIRLLALCTLVSGVYMYSKKITNNLSEKFILPTTTETPMASDEQVEGFESNLERMNKKKPVQEFECKYKFGYLQTLPKSAEIPDDCLNCHRIIECKHSYLKKPESNPAAGPSEKLSDLMISDAHSEEETVNQ